MSPRRHVTEDHDARDSAAADRWQRAGALPAATRLPHCGQARYPATEAARGSRSAPEERAAAAAIEPRLPHCDGQPGHILIDPVTRSPAPFPDGGQQLRAAQHRPGGHGDGEGGPADAGRQRERLQHDAGCGWCATPRRSPTPARCPMPGSRSRPVPPTCSTRDPQRGPDRQLGDAAADQQRGELDRVHRGRRHGDDHRHGRGHRPGISHQDRCISSRSRAASTRNWASVCSAPARIRSVSARALAAGVAARHGAGLTPEGGGRK